MANYRGVDFYRFSRNLHGYFGFSLNFTRHTERPTNT